MADTKKKPAKKSAKKKAAAAPRSERKCKIPKCKRAYRAKGYCRVHYKKWRRGEYGDVRYNICSKEGCRKPTEKGGMCMDHWKADHQKGEAAAA